MSESKEKKGEHGVMPGYLSEQQLADRFGVKRETIYRRRLQRQVPPFVRLYGKIWYRIADVDAWLLAQRVTPK